MFLSSIRHAMFLSSIEEQGGGIPFVGMACAAVNVYADEGEMNKMSADKRKP